MRDIENLDGDGEIQRLSGRERTRNGTNRAKLASSIRALRARGHGILATQLWLAQRYPQSKALRMIVAQNVARLAAERS